MLKMNFANVNSIPIAYSVFGNGQIDLVIEMGLGACMGEWWHIANQLSEMHTVLLYERAGNGSSHSSKQIRTPYNIATELFGLLQQTGCKKQITILAHSQGALYAQQFARLYPERVKAVILLDPLSANDNQFKNALTKTEYRKSGADKSIGLYVNFILSCLHLENMIKKVMHSAPPFCYYHDYSNEAADYILSCLTRPKVYKAAIDEYRQAHDDNAVSGLKERDGFPQIPLYLITHTSEIATQGIMDFGGLKHDEAQKIENVWQTLMQEYLSFSDKALFTQAQHSNHYIHLTDTDLVCSIVNECSSEHQKAQ